MRRRQRLTDLRGCTGVTLAGILLLGDPMILDVALPATVHAGQAVPITVRLTNQSREPATLYSQGRPSAFDIVVSRPDGRPVWHRLNEAVITSVLQVRELAPGEILEFADTWEQRDDQGKRVPAGDYLVTGVLPTNPPHQLRSQAVLLRILP